MVIASTDHTAISNRERGEKIETITSRMCQAAFSELLATTGLAQMGERIKM